MASEFSLVPTWAAAAWRQHETRGLEMTLKDILVHQGDEAASEARMELAIRLAQSDGAHVTVLYVMSPIEVGAPYLAEAGPKLYEMHRREVRAYAKKAEAAFRSLTQHEDVPTEWRCDEGDTGEVVTRHARYADLVIVGQTPPDEDFAPLRQVPEKVVLAAGRPVLAVPYIGAPSVVGNRIIVAWDGSREAARAVNDALPILQRAEHVFVLEIDPKGAGRIAAADICTHLARHDVRAEGTQTPSGDLNVGDVLLSRAADFACDLLVMGAYGHSRALELILGGATRYILKHMTVPVLMAH